MNKKNGTATLKKESFWERNEASGGILLRETARKRATALFRALLLFGMCFLILQPIFNKVSISFMAERDLYDTTIVVIPKHPTLDNYHIASSLMLYWKSLFNTIWVSLLVSAIEVFMCALAGYGFARFDFPFKRFWFFCVILVIIIPPQTISTSLYLHFRYFDVFGLFKKLTGSAVNLRSSMLPYLFMCCGCMGLKNGLYIFMMRQYFRGFPYELEEAAYVDGCGSFSTFIRIMLPGAKPIITSCFLFSFVWQWTDSFYTELFLGKIDMLSTQLAALAERLQTYMTLTLGKTMVTEAYTQAMNSTGILMVIIPLIILYLFAQRLFVESLTTTGVKM
jgi:multiple sugar transport system permease protein